MKRILFALWVVLLGSSAVQASVVTLTANAPDHPDAAKAKELCATAASKRSLEVFLEQLLSKTTVQANYEKVHAAFLKPYADFVRGYEMVDLKKESGMMKCEVKVDLDDVRIQSQLDAMGLRAAKGGSPNKIMVLASEQVLDHFYHGWYWYYSHSGAYNTGQCETAMIDTLTGAGYPVMDTMFNDGELAKIKAVGGQYKPENADAMAPDVAAKLAGAADSEVKYLVSCEAKAATPAHKTSQNFTSVTAFTTCRLTDVKSRSTIGTVSAEATVPHINPNAAATQAIAQACKKAGNQVVAKLK